MKLVSVVTLMGFKKRKCIEIHRRSRHNRLYYHTLLKLNYDALQWGNRFSDTVVQTMLNMGNSIVFQCKERLDSWEVAEATKMRT